ncbi:MAG: hypothetical protein KDA84_01690 [Planctomycetaceae bacterium]|nr:hypothetical protein [Planctomycetaceae bacterium]
MRFSTSACFACLFLITSLLVAGCGKPNDETTTNGEKKTNEPQKISEDPPPPPPGGGHVHPTEGPHHGSLIELGKEEYHAELLHPEHGETGSVTIYILDGSATKQFPIDAKTITLNIQHEGKPEQFTLAASPDQTDPAGQSSRFTSNDPHLIEHFGEKEIHGRLVLKIKGKSYNGELAHEH